MFVKLAVFACTLTAALAAYNGPLAGGLPAAQYPAGVDPKSCPNFPDCSNPAVAVQSPQAYQAPSQYQQQAPQYQQQAPQYQQPAPQYQQQAPQYQSAPQYQAPAPQYQPQQAQPIAHYKDAVSQYNPVLPQQYSQTSQQQYSPEIQHALNKGEYIGDGDYHGEGLREALAPEAQQPARQAYNAAPQYQQGAPQYQQAAPGPQFHPPASQIPAGVNAQACPNYPFCH